MEQAGLRTAALADSEFARDCDGAEATSGALTGSPHSPVIAEKPVLIASVDVAAVCGQASAMMSVLVSLLLTVRGYVRSRAALQLEVLALRAAGLRRVLNAYVEYYTASRTASGA